MKTISFCLKIRPYEQIIPIFDINNHLIIRKEYDYLDWIT